MSTQDPTQSRPKATETDASTAPLSVVLYASRVQPYPMDTVIVSLSGGVVVLLDDQAGCCEIIAVQLPPDVDPNTFAHPDAWDCYDQLPYPQAAGWVPHLRDALSWAADLTTPQAMAQLVRWDGDSISPVLLGRWEIPADRIHTDADLY